MQNQVPALRPDYKATQAFVKNYRSEERLKAHYVLERCLASRLRHSSPADRVKVYAQAYSELFLALPDHPQAVQNNATRERHVRKLLALLLPLLGNDKAFLEIGCGDAVLSSAVARHTARSYALDVTDALIDRSMVPQNLDILITTGMEIPVSSSSIDIALSDQLMEHLHPDDAEPQLKEIHRVLKPAGVYYCITPNRATGPHDISSFFDYEATGFHLQEYDSSSLSRLFKEAGFRRIRFIIPVGGFKLPMPRVILRALEMALLSVPRGVRVWAARRRIIGMLAGLNVIATK